MVEEFRFGQCSTGTRKRPFTSKAGPSAAKPRSTAKNSYVWPRSDRRTAEIILGFLRVLESATPRKTCVERTAFVNVLPGKCRVKVESSGVELVIYTVKGKNNTTCYTNSSLNVPGTGERSYIL